MARIRTIKPEFFRHEGLYEAEIESKLPLRVAFAGLWTVCDREGRFRWKPRAIKLDVLPYDDVDFSRVLDALMTRGFIVKYANDGEEYGFIPSWNSHQVINNKETKSILPNPSESITYTRDERVEFACPTPLFPTQGEKEGKGREKEKEKEGERKGRGAIACPPDVAEQVWDDWVTLRKQKKASITATVIDGARQEAAKAGIPFEDFLKIWCLRGSQGLQASWLKPEELGRSRPNKQEAIEASNRAVVERLLRKEGLV